MQHTDEKIAGYPHLRSRRPETEYAIQAMTLITRPMMEAAAFSKACNKVFEGIEALSFMLEKLPTH
jgi:hypothetical protein